MLELHVFTTDQDLVDDLNAAGIEGVRADYRPTMAYDTMEHLCEIVLSAMTVEGLKLAGIMIADRLRRKPPSRMDINHITINGDNNVVTIINNFIERHDKDKD
jgi:hypothetical protein